MSVCVASNGQLSNWAGYVIGESCFNTGQDGATGTTPVYVAEARWIQPAVSSSQCNWADCYVMVWTGLMTDSVGVNGIVQVGTLARVNQEGPTTSITYQAFYEFYPAAAVFWTITIKPGDYIAVTILNHGATGGDSTLYDITLIDEPLGSTVSLSNYRYSFTNGVSAPYFQAFIVENPSVNGANHLAQFTSAIAFSKMLTIPYNASPNGLPNEIQNGWYAQFTMVNGGTTNVQASSLSVVQQNGDTGDGIVCVCGKFTVSWKSNSGTAPVMVNIATEQYQQISRGDSVTSSLAIYGNTGKKNEVSALTKEAIRFGQTPVHFPGFQT
jgi:hypothetical protein